MPQPNDLSRSLVALDQDSTLVAVIEMGQASWLVAAIVPGINRHAEEDRDGSGAATASAPALGEGGRDSGANDQACCRCLRGRTRWFLAVTRSGGDAFEHARTTGTALGH